MATFPISPTNGEIATVANVAYQYNSATNSWRRVIGNISALSVAGNTTTGNLLTSGYVSATGNITGNYIVGNGSQLTGLPAGYANANATAYGQAGWAGNIIPSANAVYTLGNASNQWKSLYVSNTTIYIGEVPLSTEGNTLTVAGNTVLTTASGNTAITGNITTTGYVSALGNITGGYILGNGSQLTGLPEQYGNSNVAAYLPTYTGNVAAGNISATGNIVGGNITTSGASGNITGANVITANVFSASGNITGSYIIGNGSQLTGLPAGYANSNAASYFASGTVSTDIITTANVAGAYILGNGSTLSNITGSNVSGTVANATYATDAGTAGTVTTAAQPNITSVGTLSSVTASGNIVGGNIVTAGSVSATGAGYFGGGLFVTGNISATGNIDYTNVNDLVVGDPLIYIGANNTGDLVDLGFVANANVATVYQHLGLVRNHSTGVWGLFGNVVAEPTTVLDWANAVYQPFLSGTISSTGNVNATGDVSATGNIIGGNIITTGSSGNISGANYITANVFSASGNVVGNYILGNGSQLTGVLTLSSAMTWTTQSNTAPSGVAPGSFWYDSYSGIKYQYTNDGSGNVWVDQSFPTSFSTLAVTGNATIGGDLGVTGTITYGNIGSPGYISAVGNVTGGNVATIGLITATGNITGGNVLVNGLISSTGNITGGNVLVNGLISSTGNITGGNLSGTNITGTLLTAAQTNITSIGTLDSLTVTANVTGGNVLVNGIVSATGAVQASSLSISSNGNITGGNLSVSTGTVTVGNIVNANGNGVGNIGSSSLYFNTVFAKATSAQYADLAEMYVADQDLAPGTVVEFGGAYEVRASQTSHSTQVAGIVSTNPSYLMNAAQPGDTVVAVALTGRVPCQVVGQIRKGDRLVASEIEGVATQLNMEYYEPGCIVGKALENYDSNTVGVIEVAVGRT